MKKIYTQIKSRFEILQGGALNRRQATPAPKQLNLSKLSDAGGLKFNGCPTRQKTNLHLIWVYPFFLAAVPLLAEEVSVPPPPPPILCPQSYTIIDPKQRAGDLAQAYEMLRKEKTTAKVYFKTKKGGEISNIIDMTPMTNGTLILFRYNTPQGIKFQAVNVEEIESLSYYP